MVAILQFWGDKASAADGVVYGGCERPVSALAEYVLNTINPGLDPGSKITWDDVVTRTPWLTKRLHGMTAAQEMTVKRQALPVPGESSVRRHPQATLEEESQRGRMECRDEGFGSERGTPVPDPAGNQ